MSESLALGGPRDDLHLPLLVSKYSSALSRARPPALMAMATAVGKQRDAAQGEADLEQVPQAVEPPWQGEVVDHDPHRLQALQHAVERVHRALQVPAADRSSSVGPIGQEPLKRHGWAIGGRTSRRWCRPQDEVHAEEKVCLLGLEDYVTEPAAGSVGGVVALSAAVALLERGESLGLGELGERGRGHRDLDPLHNAAALPLIPSGPLGQLAR
eukprot:scaffold306_cov525-Prasinococcus_capsulatus_cf.AAC.19